MDKNMMRVNLNEKANISTNALAKLGHDDPISMNDMEKICRVLDCNISDVIDFITADK